MSTDSGTPYQQALAWIESHPGTGSAGSLAKLLLSLWNAECSFSYRECTDNLNVPRGSFAVRYTLTPTLALAFQTMERVMGTTCSDKWFQFHGPDLSRDRVQNTCYPPKKIDVRAADP